MSRSTSVMGLHERAESFLEGHRQFLYKETITKKYPDGNIVTKTEDKHDIPRTQYDIFDGMCGEEYPLFEYTLKDGSKAQEYVQADPWASGPCIFLALRSENGPIESTLWTDKEIEANI